MFRTCHNIVFTRYVINPLDRLKRYGPKDHLFHSRRCTSPPACPTVGCGRSWPGCMPLPPCRQAPKPVGSGHKGFEIRKELGTGFIAQLHTHPPPPERFQTGSEPREIGPLLFNPMSFEGLICCGPKYGLKAHFFMLEFYRSTGLKSLRWGFCQKLSCDRKNNRITPWMPPAI